MGQAARHRDLTEKPLRTEGNCNFGLQDLEGDFPTVPQVLGQVDGRHPTAAEFTLDRVTLSEGALEAGKQVGQTEARTRG
ncbi:MAG: hypothetical protein AUH45_05860 [Gemmatimonadetes bacterium 13_1_40CM_69_22]|nr:MAG: hypothetical protein AUH45_05860 [Gemmatimonadetes bacterium 13_1_40CM_69_22]